MESFGIWYKESESENTPKFSIHVNLWFLGDILENAKHKSRKNAYYPYLDIGIKIDNYKAVDELTYHCPFAINRDNLEDLSSKMILKSNAVVIFNDECEVETISSYTCVKFSDNNQLLIFPINDSIIEEIYYVQTAGNKSNIVFDINKFRSYVGEKEELNNHNSIYIRFRIINVKLEDKIYFDSEPLNKSFNSAFSGTRIIDFKINEKRNIDNKLQAKMLLNKQRLAAFEKVHFLIMEPSSYDLKAFSDYQMSCRELEEELWKDYLGEKGPFLRGHILAYHWKACSGKDEEISKFSCLVKVDYSKTRISTILIYLSVVLALGVLGSTLVSGTQVVLQHFFSGISEYNYICFIIDLLISAALFLPIVLNKTK